MLLYSAWLCAVALLENFHQIFMEKQKCQTQVTNQCYKILSESTILVKVLLLWLPSERLISTFGKRPKIALWPCYPQHEASQGYEYFARGFQPPEMPLGSVGHAREENTNELQQLLRPSYHSSWPGSEHGFIIMFFFPERNTCMSPLTGGWTQQASLGWNTLPFLLPAAPPAGTGKAPCSALWPSCPQNQITFLLTSSAPFQKGRCLQTSFSVSLTFSSSCTWSFNVQCISDINLHY